MPDPARHADPAARPAAPSAGRPWHRVHDVVGPLAGHPAPLGLSLHGGAAGPVVATSTGMRAAPTVAAGGRLDFGAYLNAFPAAHWRAYAGSAVVRLTVEVDAVAVLTVRASDAAVAVVVVEKRLLAAGVPEHIEVDISSATDGGLVWFDLLAGPHPVALVDAGWSVRQAPRPGGVVLGTPTTGRIADVAANLRRIAAAPALLGAVDAIVIVDHAPTPIAQALTALLDGVDLGGRLRVVRQPNLGGSGGYSRAMHEAVATPGAEAVLLLDDDIAIDPAALLRAIEFGRRTRGGQIVGLQMFDTARPGVLDAAAERIRERTFWWGPSDPELAAADVAARPVADSPALHRRTDADFAGWWGSLVPLDVVRAIGYSMPFFVKWDDAEYALRAAEAGFGTVSLQGAAVWHDSWRGKDDARSWPAYFHSRNRVVAALLHGGPRVRTGVLLDGLMVELKQLLALQTFAVERRQEGLAAVLAGPEALGEPAEHGFERLQRLSAAADDQRRIPPAEADGAHAARARVPAPRRAPEGAALGVWTALQVLRHLVAPVVGAGRPPGRLDAGRGTWWVLPSYDHVLAPTADGAAFFRLRRDPRRFRALLATSLALHLRLFVAWPRLRRRYRRAAARLAAPASWERRFEGGAA